MQISLSHRDSILLFAQVLFAPDPPWEWLRRSEKFWTKEVQEDGSLPLSLSVDFKSAFEACHPYRLDIFDKNRFIITL